MGSAELTPAHTRTGGSCTKAAGRLSELNTCKLCGRRSTMSGRRGPRPSCPSGSASAQARRPVNPTPPRTMMRAVPMSQLRLKRKKKRKKKKRRRKKRRKKKTEEAGLRSQRAQGEAKAAAQTEGHEEGIGSRGLDWQVPTQDPHVLQVRAQN